MAISTSVSMTQLSDIAIGFSRSKIDGFLKSDLCMSFTISKKHLHNWKKCGLIADFFSNYLIEGNEDTITTPSVELSTITNELIENAVKFSPDNFNGIQLSLRKSPNDDILLFIDNTATTQHCTFLFNTMKQLKTTNLFELKLKKLNQLCNNHPELSQMGLITLIADYNIKLGVTFNPIRNSPYKLVSMICILNSSPAYNETYT